MNDQQLHALFQQARREEAEAAPAFAATLARARAARRPRRLRAGLVAALAIAGGIVALLILRGRPDMTAAGPVDLAAVRWTAPTDFLLETPGAELLRTVPRIAIVGTVAAVEDTDTGGPR